MTNDFSENNTFGSTQPHININTQYVKDLSFESPGAPASIFNNNASPKVEINLDLAATALSEEAFEVELKITITAKGEESVLFLTELTYAGVFTLHNISESEREAILFVHCPSILFPYARRVVSDVTRDGGFQPLMIAPVDFAALYAQKKQATFEDVNENFQ